MRENDKMPATPMNSLDVTEQTSHYHMPLTVIKSELEQGETNYSTNASLASSHASSPVLSRQPSCRGKC